MSPLAQALTGIALSFIMAYLDSVAKLFMIGAAMVFTAVASFLVFGTAISVSFAFGATLVVGSVLAYNGSTVLSNRSVPTLLAAVGSMLMVLLGAALVSDM